MKKTRAHFLTTALVITSMVLAPMAQAQVPTEYTGSGGGAEFFVGKEMGKPLVRVNLMNGVARPGVYHVPIDTNLAELMAYAGGAGPKSDLNEVSIRREGAGKAKSVNVELKDIMKATSSIPGVQDNDIIHITQRTALDDTTKYLTLISAVFSVVVSYYIVRDINEK